LIGALWELFLKVAEPFS